MRLSINFIWPTDLTTYQNIRMVFGGQSSVFLPAKHDIKTWEKILLFFIESFIVIGECLPLQRRLRFDSQQLDKPKTLNMVITVFYFWGKVTVCY